MVIVFILFYASCQGFISYCCASKATLFSVEICYLQYPIGQVIHQPLSHQPSDVGL